MGTPDHAVRLGQDTLPDIGRHVWIGNARHVDDVAQGEGFGLFKDTDVGGLGDWDILVSGEADHRDMVLLPEEMDSQIMVCVSRAKSDELVIDL